MNTLKIPVKQYDYINAQMYFIYLKLVHKLQFGLIGYKNLFSLQRPSFLMRCAQERNSCQDNNSDSSYLFNQVFNEKKLNLAYLHPAHIFQITSTIILRVSCQNDWQHSLMNYPKPKIKYIAILQWLNGRPVQIPQHLLQSLTKALNDLNKSNPYCYSAEKGQIHFVFKINARPSHQQNQYIDSYLQLKVQKIATNIIYAFQLYAVPGFRTGKHSNEQFQYYSKKIDMKKKSLQMKQKFCQIMLQLLAVKKRQKQQQKQLQAKQKQKQKQKEQKQHIQLKQLNLNPVQNNLKISVSQQQEHGVCEFYSAIEPLQHKLKKGDFMHDPVSIMNNKVNEKFSITYNKFILSKYENEHKVETQNYLVKKQLKQIQQLIEPQNQKLHEKRKKKLSKQIQIIKSIRHQTKHFLKYYFIENQSQDQKSNFYYMQYVQTNLSFWMNNSIFSLQSSICRFVQIVKGIQGLHQSGIVHRDLKPENILVYDSTQSIQQYEYNMATTRQKEPSTKIIDFSDSAMIKDEPNSELSNLLGYSLPYSPFQCCFDCKFGVNNPKIDVWSLGILLHQFVFLSLPCIYIKNVTIPQFIQSLQKNQLSVKINSLWHRKCFNSTFLQIFHILIQYCLLLKQRDRISLANLYEIVLLVKTNITEVQKQIRKRNPQREYKLIL